ncbi:MAG: hypothetical protein COB20_12225 [SAR86 cluster bacterium]|uniref:Peptidase M56 domain-containing protein n=1 Tax=SAR86 cluster bacterium TaxID=2030880 RepID=A0A2A4WZU6_9GAMM|nr:MAG: hypothetical protein COB20_12225 [SAR86 cluster bacterium]
MSVGIISEHVAILNAEPLSIEAFGQAFVKFPLSSELSFVLLFLLVLGILLKLFFYIRSLCALRLLVYSSKAVEGEWTDVLERSSKIMRMNRSIELRQSGRVSTPSTCGVLSPCIILPSAMVSDSCLAQSGAQVLQHELAHIKRHDPLIAGLQAVVSIFLFWHPAVNYVNKNIRYEREIACDDWVVSNNAQHDNAGVKAYAYSIVSIAESLTTHTAPAHSVACVNNSSGLQERIRILLDRRADHSTSVNLMSNLWVASIALGFLFFSSALLPKLPFSLFPKNSEIGVAALSVLPVAPYAIAVESENSTHDSDPVAAIPAPHLRQLVAYDVPLPIPEFNRSLAGDEANVSRSRAERIGSMFASKAVETKYVDTLAMETIKPILTKFAPVLVDEFVDQRAGFPDAAFTMGNTQPEKNDLVIVDSLSRAELVDEIMEIELELYRVFNSVTERNDLKMYCESQAILGSYINQTTCEPEFLRTARSENFGHSMGTAARMSEYNTSVGLRKDMKAEYAELAAEILREMQGNQYLLELYQVLVGLRGRLVEMA